MKSRVFAVHPVREDISAAFQYGEIYYINKSYVYPDQLVGEDQELPAPVTDALDAAADEFNHETDYFLIIGDHLQLMEFSVCLAAVKPYFKVLRFDRQAAGYVPVKLLGLS